MKQLKAFRVIQICTVNESKNTLQNTYLPFFPFLTRTSNTVLVVRRC